MAAGIYCRQKSRTHEAESSHAGPGVTVLTHGGFRSRMMTMVMRGEFADFVETRYEGTGFACALYDSPEAYGRVTNVD